MYTLFKPDLFFFNDTATTEIYTLSLHDALPILRRVALPRPDVARRGQGADADPSLHRGLHRPQVRRHAVRAGGPGVADRKSTRLNSSHANISYAVFCLKKKRLKSRHSLTSY